MVMKGKLLYGTACNTELSDDRSYCTHEARSSLKLGPRKSFSVSSVTSISDSILFFYFLCYFQKRSS
jgi:hypothetical protein